MEDGRDPLFIFRPFFYKTYQLLTTAIMRLFFFKLTVTGLKNIPKDGGYIIISNHIGHLDPYILMKIFPQRLSFMANKNTFFLSLIAGLSAGDCITSAGSLAIIEAQKRILKNRIVLFFPEGGRSNGDYPAEAKSGAAFLALKTKTRILPVKITGTDKAMDPRIHSVKFGAKIQISIDKPILLDEHYYSQPLWVSAKEAIQVIMQRINSLE
ncbi:MAG: lysophospholipid acyltransferase family protein [Candidatus Omnitrophota bacterium]